MPHLAKKKLNYFKNEDNPKIEDNPKNEEDLKTKVIKNMKTTPLTLKRKRTQK